MEQRDPRAELTAAEHARIRRASQPREPAPGDGDGELNVVPFLDIIMNVLMFVLATIPAVFTATALVSPPAVDGPRPTKPTNALNLAVIVVDGGVAIKASGGAVGPGCEPGGGVAIPKQGGDYDWRALRSCVSRIKASNDAFASETEVKILAEPGVAYQTVIAAMDAVRQTDDGAPLFPEVNFALPRLGRRCRGFRPALRDGEIARAEKETNRQDAKTAKQERGRESAPIPAVLGGLGVLAVRPSSPAETARRCRAARLTIRRRDRGRAADVVASEFEDPNGGCSMSVLDTIMGWFVAKKDEHETLELAPPPRSLAEHSPPPPTGPIDFTAVLAGAGVATDVRERVTKAKNLLRKLPPDAKPAMKRAIVEAAFQAFDIVTEKIVEGASAEVDALRAYIRAGEAEKTTRLADGERRIAELEGEIATVRASMEAATAAQERRDRLTTEEIATVSPIVDFFLYESTSMPPPAGVVALEPASIPPPSLGLVREGSVRPSAE